MAWAYDDLPARVAELSGAKPRETADLPGGGEGPILLLNQVANRIADGELEIALLAGAEAVYSRRRARTEGATLSHWSAGGEKFPRFLVEMKPFANALEQRHGVRNPVEMYPVYENALRARAGRSIDAHQRHVAALMARYSEVAARNPLSWFPEPRTADEIRTRRRAQSLDRLSVSEAHERDHGGRPGRGRDRHVGVRGRPARDRARAARALPGRRVRARRLERGGARRSRVEPRLCRGRARDAGARGDRRGRRRALRPVQLLPVRGRVRARRARALDDRPAPAHADGRARAPRRPRQQLRDARAGQHRIASARGRGTRRLGLGAGNERDQARDRRALDRRAARRGRGRTVRRCSRCPKDQFEGPALVDAPEGPAEIESYTVRFDRDEPARAELDLPASARRPAQPRPGREERRAVPSAARGRGRRRARPRHGRSVETRPTSSLWPRARRPARRTRRAAAPARPRRSRTRAARRSRAPRASRP